VLNGRIAGAGQKLEALPPHRVVCVALPVGRAGHTLPGHGDVVNEGVPVGGVVQPLGLRLQHPLKFVEMHRRLGVGSSIGLLAQPRGGKGFEYEPLGMVKLLLKGTESKKRVIIYICLFKSFETLFLG